MRYWFIIGLSIILGGCSSNIKFIEPPKPVYNLPVPVKPSNVKWKVITKETMKNQKDSVVFVGLTYDDSITHRQWLESLKIYIEQQQAIICKHQNCEE